MQKAFIIFGGSGFVGSHLFSLLKNNDPDSRIIVADLVKPAFPAEFILTDVRKPIQWTLPEATDALIYNLAAIHKTPGHPDAEYFETNIRGAENVCAFARANDINRIVFTSSIAPYGTSEKKKSEDTLPMPNTPYGISKLVAEKIHLAWAAENATRVLGIVRPGIVFGKGEGGNFTRLYKAIRKGMFAYAGRKDTRKANIYVKDLVNVMNLMSQAAPGTRDLLNCCYPQAQTIEEIAKAVKKVTGIKHHIFLIPASLLNAAAFVLKSFDKLNLGIHPDRIKKLMISTNIDGSKLSKKYSLQFTLEQAIFDWYEDCDRKGLG
ncbi:MAG TPA: NAD(P)-dependent oxidoreductase [Fibrobacteraceae bacterium]|nr:NAD(P)-dependent oxidoreductase [Fibrobacteraceae bacterium]